MEKKLGQHTVFVDFCGTLFTSNTTFEFLDFFFKNKHSSFYHKINSISKLVFFKATNHLIYKIFSIDIFRIYKLKCLKGYSRKEIEQEGVRYAKDILLPHKKRSEIWSRIANYENQDYKITVVSGGLDFIVKTICGLHNWSYYASSLKFINGTCKGSYDKDILLSKIDLIKDEIQAKTDFDYIGISDNKTDINWLKMMSKTIVISKRKNNSFWKRNLKNTIETIII